MAKKNFVVKMFDNIAPTYDKLNHLLSLNVDKSWRRRAVSCIVSQQPQQLLDVACGTGDFAIALAQAGVPHVHGIDISEGMLQVGCQKVAQLGLNIDMAIDDCTALSASDNSYDAVSVAFGVRNFEQLQQGLNEMHRVLRPGGQLCVLELSVPSNPIVCWCYKLYFVHLLPLVGGWLSGNRTAYQYLPQSVLKFPKPDVFCDMLRQAGFQQVQAESFTLGLCRMYIGKK